MNDEKVETNVFWQSAAARGMIALFEQSALAAGYDFLLIVVDPKTKVHRTVYHCQEKHDLMTQAIDQSYGRLVEWYQSRGYTK